MELVILAMARFRRDQKEAMSKNFVNLAQCLTEGKHQVLAVTPTGFESKVIVPQQTFRQHSRYESLLEGLSNLVRMCWVLNRLVSVNQQAKVNIHIATPIELLIVFLFLKSSYRKQTTLSIWQSYLTYQEFKGNQKYFLLNLLGYFHLIVFNSFITATLYRRLLGDFQQAIVHSAYQQRQLKALSNLPIRFVQNGVFPEVFSPPSDLEQEGLALLYLGHAKPSKGVDALIALAAKLKQRGQVDFNLTLCLSGFGCHKQIEALIAANQLEQYVRFKGDIDIAFEMARADLLVLPLRTCVGTSLTPNVIVEAISCGLPIAVPKFAQLKDVIQFGKNALEIDLHDMTTSAKSIESVYHNNQLIRLSSYQLEQLKPRLTLEQFVAGYCRELGLE